MRLSRFLVYGGMTVGLSLSLLSPALAEEPTATVPPAGSATPHLATPEPVTPAPGPGPNPSPAKAVPTPSAAQNKDANRQPATVLDTPTPARPAVATPTAELAFTGSYAALLLMVGAAVCLLGALLLALGNPRNT